MEQTAVIKVQPGVDEAIVALHAEALKLRAFAEARIIATDGDVKEATNDLSLIGKLRKTIEEKHKEYAGPINDHLKAVNEVFKAFTEPLIQADTITRQKVTAYRNEQERIRQEEERINALRIEAAHAEKSLKGEITEPVNTVEVRPEQPDRYRAEVATLGTVTHWKYEVMDFAQVPDEYKMLDASKVGKLVRGGLRIIPGIRIFPEKDLRVTDK